MLFVSTIDFVYSVLFIMNMNCLSFCIYSFSLDLSTTYLLLIPIYGLSYSISIVSFNEFTEVESLDECFTDDNKKYCTKKLKIGYDLLQRVEMTSSNCKMLIRARKCLKEHRGAISRAEMRTLKKENKEYLTKLEENFTMLRNIVYNGRMNIALHNVEPLGELLDEGYRLGFTPEMLNKYGTYEVQATADSENQYPAIAQGFNAKAIKTSFGSSLFPICAIRHIFCCWVR